MNSVMITIELIYLYLSIVSSELSFIVLVDDKIDIITAAVDDAIHNTESTDKQLNYSSILQTKVPVPCFISHNLLSLLL